MRTHLIRAALDIYGRQGVDGSVIEELIKTAGVSRGTFYNYFKTNQELLEAVSTAVSNELMMVVDPRIQQHEDPAARISVGVRLCLEIGKKYRQIALFISRGGPLALSKNRLLAEYLPRDLKMGIDSGRFANLEMQLAFDLVVGPALAGFFSLAVGNVRPDYIEQLSVAVLMSLGIGRSEALELSCLPLENIELSDELQTHILRFDSLNRMNGPYDFGEEGI